jgi:hypothetical protein
VIVSYQIPWRHPSSLLHNSLRILINFRRRLRDLIHRNLIPLPRPLNITQRLLQLLQLHLDLALGLLGILHGDLLERLDALDLLVDIVGFRLERLEVLLDLVDDLGVVEDGAVLLEVDGGGLLLQLLQAAAGVVVAFLEVGEGGGGGAAKGQLGGQFCPVEFGCCSGLGRSVIKAALSAGGQKCGMGLKLSAVETGEVAYRCGHFESFREVGSGEMEEDEL